MRLPESLIWNHSRLEGIILEVLGVIDAVVFVEEGVLYNTLLR